MNQITIEEFSEIFCFSCRSANNCENNSWKDSCAIYKESLENIRKQNGIKEKKTKLQEFEDCYVNFLQNGYHSYDLDNIKELYGKALGAIEEEKCNSEQQ